MNQPSPIQATWSSSTSMIFWGVLTLTVFGCAASFCEFFFGLSDAAKEWIDKAFDTAASLGNQTHAEGFFKFYAAHNRLAIWTRAFEVLNIGGWIVYVIGLSKFRQAQSTDKGRWLTNSLYSACWLGLVGIGCTFIGGFLGIFGFLFRFIGWVLTLISLFKFRGAFNRLSVEESWNSLAQRGAGNLRSSYTFGTILAFYPIIIFLTLLFIGLGSISNISSIAEGVANNGANAGASLIGGSILIFMLLGLAAVILWVCQVCYLISGWCKVKNGSLTEFPEDEYINDNSTIMTLSAILGTIILICVTAWSCMSPLTHKDGTYSISRDDMEDAISSEDSEYRKGNEGIAPTYTQPEEQVEPYEEATTHNNDEAAEYFNTYKGTINNKYEIEMTLNSDGGSYYNGEYYYTKNKQPIQLRGQLTDDDAHLVLEEYVGMDMTGKFEGTLSNRGYSGTWTSADGKRSYPFTVGQ